MDFNEFTACLKTGANLKLNNSLFYYCCGRDATPIISFKGQYQIYVYVDNLKQPRQEFEAVIKTLFSRLCNFDFKLVKNERLQGDELFFKCENAQLSKWQAQSGDSFFLLYLQGDATTVYQSLYFNQGCLPKCICNYRYEMPNRALLQKAESMVEYVFGHCFSCGYQLISQHHYYGDYAFNQEVKVGLYVKTADV